MSDETTSRSLGLEKIFKVVQLLSILAAGVSAVWIYFEHDREQGRLSIESLKLSNDQASKMAKIQLESGKLSRDQQAFSLRQQILLANTETSSKEMALKQQEFAYQQSIANATSIRDQQRYSAKIAELEGKLKTADLDFKMKGRISYQADLKISCDDPSSGTYLVTFSARVSNVTQEPVEVSWNHVRIFLGEPDESKRTAGDFIAVNSIPRLFDGPSQSPIRWREVYGSGNLYPGREELERALPFRAVLGRGVTGRLLKDETNSDTFSFQTWGRAGTQVGAKLLFGTDGHTVDKNGTVFVKGRPISLDETRGGTGVYETWTSAKLPECRPSAGKSALSE